MGGSATVPLEKATADQICPFLIDFFNIHKWIPGLPTCYGVHGNNGDVGSIRCCSGISIPSVDGTTSWETEKLIAVDPSEKMIMYEIVDSNIEFNSYLSTIKICPASGDEGYVMWWIITVDPIKGWRMEELVGNYEAI